jgi:hypothetical protein
MTAALLRLSDGHALDYLTIDLAIAAAKRKRRLLREQYSVWSGGKRVYTTVGLSDEAFADPIAVEFRGYARGGRVDYGSEHRTHPR